MLSFKSIYFIYYQTNIGRSFFKYFPIFHAWLFIHLISLAYRLLFFCVVILILYFFSQHFQIFIIIFFNRFIELLIFSSFEKICLICAFIFHLVFDLIILFFVNRKLLKTSKILIILSFRL